MNKNREIKLRVWCVLNGIGRFYTLALEEYGSFNFDILDDKPVFQEWTGLKDRKGKEIYEGDIVNTNGGNHVIEWRGAGFACTWSDYNLDSCWFMGGGPVVVGNIFENAELADRARKGPTK
jgi:hypothetical protein